MSRGVLAAVVAVCSIAVFGVELLFDRDFDPTAVVMFGSATTTSVLVGLLLIQRAPANRIGPLLLATGVTLAIAAGLSSYALAGAARTPPLTGVAIAGMATDILFTLAIVLALIVIPLVFPTGHLISRRWRWILWLLVGALAAQTFAFLFGSETVIDPRIANPLFVRALQSPAAWLGAAASATSVIGFGGAAAAVWVRYRRGDLIERQQVKWLLAVAGLAAICFPIAFIVPVEQVANVAFALGVLTMAMLPIAIAVAILRYHLYEIDRIVSRTLSYAIVTGVLGAVFVGTVLLLQTALAGVTGSRGVPVAISTLAVFALFQPVLRRVRRAVDRRFDRARYDGERTAREFAERLRWQTDMDLVTGDLTRTTTSAVAPTSLGIWLRPPWVPR